jgi:hypothetical protein
MIYIETVLKPHNLKHKINIKWLPSKSDDLPEGVIHIIFNIYGTPSKREALAIVFDAIIKNDINWLNPISYDEWFIDLDSLKTRFDILKSIDWLKGKMILYPEYKTPDMRGKGWATSCIEFIISSFETRNQIYSGSFSRISEYLNNFVQDHQDVNGCAFLMMKYEETEMHRSIIKIIKETCSQHNIKVLRADDKQYADDILENIMVYMQGCKFGIALYERLTEDDFNPNVSLEVGYMIAINKPVCLLKDKTLIYLHTDLIGRLYKAFDPQKPEDSIPIELNKWLVDKGFIDKE